MSKLKSVLTIKRILIEAMFIFLLGSVMHFVYEWSGGNNLFGLVSPISESVWEHNKLFILPLVIVSYLRYRDSKDLRSVLNLSLIQFLFMTTFIVSFFYTYIGALGVEEILIVDIASFGLASFLGSFLTIVLLKFKPLPTAFSEIMLFLILGFYIYATVSPPAIPLFQSS